MDSESFAGLPALAAPASAAPRPSSHPVPTTFAPGVTNANWFGLFNAISWSIALGSPAVLYAKSLGASDFILGLMASFTPLLVIFQIPAAHWLPKYGYRRFILAGWGSRTVLIFALAAIPLLSFLAPSLRLWLIIASLFAFNLLRGIASGAWLPWISELIPEHLRGRFLSRDQVFAQVGCLGAMCICAIALRGDGPHPFQYTLVFLISACGATLSLWFVKRVPDVTAPEKLKSSSHRVPWLHMLAYPPFFRLMVLNLLYFAMTGGLGVFTVAFLKGQAGYSESRILWLSAISILGALATVPWVGRVLDRVGSRPVLRICILAFILILLGWWSVAAHLVHHAILVIALLNLFTGVAGINFNVANARLQMATMPVMGRNHFFALFTVITNIGLGLSPIAWGFLLDAIGHRAFTTGLLNWNRYSIYFALTVVLAVVTLQFVGRLHEKERV